MWRHKFAGKKVPTKTLIKDFEVVFYEIFFGGICEFGHPGTDYFSFWSIGALFGFFHKLKSGSLLVYQKVWKYRWCMEEIVQPLSISCRLEWYLPYLVAIIVLYPRSNTNVLIYIHCRAVPGNIREWLEEKSENFCLWDSWWRREGPNIGLVKHFDSLRNTIWHMKVKIEDCG